MQWGRPAANCLGDGGMGSRRGRRGGPAGRAHTRKWWRKAYQKQLVRSCWEGADRNTVVNPTVKTLACGGKKGPARFTPLRRDGQNLAENIPTQLELGFSLPVFWAAASPIIIIRV